MEARGRLRRRELLMAMAGGTLIPQLGCGAADGSLGTSATPQPASSKPLGVALLGLGQYSETQLAPALQRTRYCALRGIVTGTPAKVEKWQRQYGIADHNVYNYESLPQIANNTDIQVVYVVVPTALHAKYSILAAEAGKHVWCEKPMAMTVEECQQIIDACRANRVSLSIGYRMYHEPNTQTVMRFAREKPYGSIQQVRAVAGDRSRGEPSWRMVKSMGGGALYDMGVYSVNAIRYAAAEEPVRVLRARQWADRPELFHEVDESTEFELELPSGAVALGKASRFDPENILRVEANRGWYELQPMQQYSGVQGRTSDGQRLDATIDNQQARQMDNESLAILEGRPPIATPEDGLRDIRIIQAIIRSAESGVAVPL